MGAFDLPGGDIPGATQFLVQVPKQIQNENTNTNTNTK